MRDVKRIEIVVEAPQEEVIRQLIEDAGIDGFTLMHAVAGRGQRGDRTSDGLSSAFQNIVSSWRLPPIRPPHSSKESARS
ncbi:MAG: hypothetical protein R3E53_18340 [Myxococcota bacterium]